MRRKKELTDDQIREIEGRYYVSPAEPPNGRKYIKVLGPTVLFGKRTERRLQVEIFWQVSSYPDQGYWEGVRNRSDGNMTFRDFRSYQPVEEKDLPWNNGAKWWSESPGARLSSEDLRRLLEGISLLPKSA
ncbi:MAG: hypothetical protein WC796_01395 [Candidatus Pacearchaeota archaeon]|jgi:hypothetical protein